MVIGMAGRLMGFGRSSEIGLTPRGPSRLPAERAMISVIFHDARI
jgi:hypothetical protein